jgi:maleylacetate reductase
VIPKGDSSPEATVPPFVHESLSQRVVFGWGRLVDLPNEVDRLSKQRLLLISEGSTQEFADRAIEMLGDRSVSQIPSVRPHVPVGDVFSARRLVREHKVDLVITIGGGSATGLGKAIAVEGLALLSIPTTYAGSEATPIYGITDGGRKTARRDTRALPGCVIYDPQLTVSLPPHVSATTGLNAIAHCVEALYAANATPITNLLAVEGIRVLNSALRVVVDQPHDSGSRSRALYGSYLAGNVLASTGMAIHHRICHVLGGTFGLSHGDVNAVILPHAIAFNLPAAGPAIERVATALGTADPAGAVFDLASTLGAPTSLSELGLAADSLDEVAEITTEGEFYNPRPATREDVLGILKAAYEGVRPT